ncbi:hypothetical protein BC829DRAFT_403046 [Chytridium lagenaria]|nr:hypothetical protein BC829DRAFT_403046 [Chytridium lagenaria]
MDVVLTQLHMVAFATMFVLPVSAVSWSAYEIISQISNIAIGDIPALNASAVSVMAYSLGIEFASAFMITHKVRGWKGVVKQFSSSTIMRIGLEAMVLLLLSKNVKHWVKTWDALGISICSFFSLSFYNYHVLNGIDLSELVQNPNARKLIFVTAFINCITLSMPFWIVASCLQFCSTQGTYLNSSDFNFVRVTNFCLMQFPVKVIRFMHTGEFQTSGFWLLTCTQVISDRILPRIARYIMKLVARAKKIGSTEQPQMDMEAETSSKPGDEVDPTDLPVIDGELGFNDNVKTMIKKSSLPPMQSSENRRDSVDNKEHITDENTRVQNTSGMGLNTTKMSEVEATSEVDVLAAAGTLKAQTVEGASRISQSTLQPPEDLKVSPSTLSLSRDSTTRVASKRKSSKRASTRRHRSESKRSSKYIYPEYSMNEKTDSVQIDIDGEDDALSVDSKMKILGPLLKERTQVAIKQAADKVDTVSEDYHGHRNDYVMANYITTLTAMLCATLLPDTIRPCSRSEVLIAAAFTMVLDLLLEIGLSLAEKMGGIPVGTVTTFGGYTFLGVSGLFTSYYMAVYAGVTGVISIG